MNEIHQRFAISWLLTFYPCTTTCVPVRKSCRHLLGFPKMNNTLTRASNPPATGIWVIKEKARYRSEYSFKNPTCLPSISTILTFIILLPIVCPWLARNTPFSRRNKLCPTRKAINFALNDSGIPFAALDIKWSQNPVTIAMPISKGINIIESISTAPTREPRPASVVVCSVMLFLSVIWVQ